MLNIEQAVLEANDTFYEAFASRDYAAMSELWSSSQQIACIHPGWQILRGREHVMASWRAILESEVPGVECHDVQASLFGDVAFVTCVEYVPRSKLMATNIFSLEKGIWKMVHHQAGPFAGRKVSHVMRPPDNKLN